MHRLGPVTQLLGLGSYLATCIAGGPIAGYFLDRWLDTAPALTLAGLEFSGRIDRMDRLADGSGRRGVAERRVQQIGYLHQLRAEKRPNGIGVEERTRTEANQERRASVPRPAIVSLTKISSSAARLS